MAINRAEAQTKLTNKIIDQKTCSCISISLFAPSFVEYFEFEFGTGELSNSQTSVTNLHNIALM